VTPPNWIGTSSLPARSFVQDPIDRPRLKTGKRTASMASMSRAAPSMTRPAMPRAWDAAVRISPHAPACV
jgi:hypothetical protein